MTAAFSSFPTATLLSLSFPSSCELHKTAAGGYQSSSHLCPVEFILPSMCPHGKRWALHLDDFVSLTLLIQLIYPLDAGTNGNFKNSLKIYIKQVCFFSRVCQRLPPKRGDWNNGGSSFEHAISGQTDPQSCWVRFGLPGSGRMRHLHVLWVEILPPENGRKVGAVRICLHQWLVSKR